MDRRFWLKRLLLVFGFLVVCVSIGPLSRARDIESRDCTIVCGGDIDSKGVVSIYDRNTKAVMYSIVLGEVYSSHYHPMEFHKDRLYVIHRTGGSGGYQRFPDTWTDELWCYDRDKKGSKLFSARGLDFRASPDNRKVVVVERNAPNFEDGHVNILDENGQVVNRRRASEYGLKYPHPLSLTNDALFLVEGGPGSCLDRLIEIDLSDLSWVASRMDGLEFCLEYDFNAETKRVVGSDHPFLFDTESEEGWLKERPAVTLYVYDFNTKAKAIIARSRGKAFGPRWLDNRSIEYDDPDSDRRVTVKPF